MVPIMRLNINLGQDKSKVDSNQAKIQLESSATSRLRWIKDSPIKSSQSRAKQTEKGHQNYSYYEQTSGVLKSKTQTKPKYDCLDPDLPSLVEPCVLIIKNCTKLELKGIEGNLDLKFKEPSNLVSSNRQIYGGASESQALNQSQTIVQDHVIKHANERRRKERTRIMISQEAQVSKVKLDSANLSESSDKSSNTKLQKMSTHSVAHELD